MRQSRETWSASCSSRSLRCRTLSAASPNVQVLADLPRAHVERLLARYGLTLVMQDRGEAITGSFWGDSEAGIVGHSVYARGDTPLHSLLHEACHVICMTGQRRRSLVRDAGGDDAEEAAVCYLQVLLADEIPGIGRDRLMADMDAWSYSFRLGSTAAWFERDADDALRWLIERGIVAGDGTPTFAMRQ